MVCYFIIVYSTAVQDFWKGEKSKTLTMKVKLFIPLLISFAIAAMPKKKYVSFTGK